MTLWPVFYLSLLINSITGGSIHQTVSARAGYARMSGSKGARVACHLFDAVDPRIWIALDHCDEAILKDYERHHPHS